MTRIAFYGSSILSSYWNGAATYYRGILRALAERGYDITFYEPDAFDRQSHRDVEAPPWCRVVVYPATSSGLDAAVGGAAAADIVVKASGVGFCDDQLLTAVMRTCRRETLRVWWDVDAPATLAEVAGDGDHPLRRSLTDIDLVLTYGGGAPVVSAYRLLGAPGCHPIYNALDPTTHHPVASDGRFQADLGFLGNRLPDRERRVETFFLEPARLLSAHRFLLGGSGWADKDCPDNVDKIGHVATTAHNAFNCSPLAVLNINRDSMAATGFSPPTRIFEAAGAGACLLSDAWEGIDMFLQPGEEVLVVRDGTDVAEALRMLDPIRAHAIGQAALRRVLAEHTYDRRATEVDRLLRAAIAVKAQELAA